MYYGHISSFFLFFFFFFFFVYFTGFQIDLLVICHCMQIVYLVSVWMQTKLAILSIQTFVGEHEHAVSILISSTLSDK